MGLVPSLIRKGLSPKQIVNLAIDGVYKNLMANRYDSFEQFHDSILSLFKTANSALPGRHFEAPARADVKKAFLEWQQKPANSEEQKKIFTELLQSTKLGQIDKTTLIVGLATPPFSMVVKRAGENWPPPFKMINNVPDALFVPSFTVLSLVSVKLIRKVLEKNREERDKEFNIAT